ncbi:MAG: peptidoglycan/LPS O-acetylase OafA/YrhL [Candidatus Azotimanducaceae bacterium]|jgi:peptidoglycan/LPS O-acetylase OafA/YrhL
MSNKLRFYEIDGLRFIAAILVVFYHYTFRGYAADNMSVVPFEGISVLSRYGYLGVDLFFIISGFVILLSAQHGDSMRFIVSRIVRIYPAFWVGLTVTSIAMALYALPPFEITWSQWALNLPLIGSFLGVEYVDGVYWSLLVELKFYFLILLLLLFGQITRTEYFMGGWLLITAVLTFADGPGAAHFFFFPEWAHYFVAGAMFYTLRVNGFNLYRVTVLLGAFALSIYNVYSSIALTAGHYQAEFSTPIAIGFVTLFYAVFLLVSLNKTGWVNHPMLLPVGALTYPLYLVHQNIGFIVINTLHESINKYVLLVLTIAIAIGLAWAINAVAEKRFGPILKSWLEIALKPLIQLGTQLQKRLQA